MNKEEFIRAYTATTYSFSVDAEIGSSVAKDKDNDIRWNNFHIGECNQALNDLLQKHHVLAWAILSAFNPYSETIPLTENLHREHKLLTQLNSTSYLIYAAQGKDDNDLWPPEPSLLILGIQPNLACQLAQEYQQNAIIIGQLNTPAELLWTAD
ncbi:MAG: DUF3293 domain-containing protein [Planctomycetes bacterium]|nr:DUF3293 domain-containing protein [Planctomycetota bacterium]